LSLPRSLAFAAVLAACAPAILEAPPQPAPIEPIESVVFDTDADADADADVEEDAAPMAAIAEPPRAVITACNEQEPLPFLIRGSYAHHPHASHQEGLERKANHRRSIEFRTRHYGYVDGFGEPTWNRFEPKHYTAAGSFFGIKIRMNARVLVALGCVEESIKQACESTPYSPRVLDGLRFKNTFHNNEVSNHTYGIAIDVDWDKNPCCGCIAPINASARCKDTSLTTAWERTYLPKCWVDQFERFGFYWLGKDELEDTMHFEFLGDPEKIARR